MIPARPEPAVPRFVILPQTMKLRLILPAAVSIAFAASSCTPYVEPAPDAPADPAQRTVSAEEQQKIKERREQLKKEEEAAGREGTGTDESVTDRPKEKPEGGSTAGTSDTPKPSQETKPASIPVARPVPGKPGMVFSPFNNKIIDVKGIPSGKLVADPTFPASEKKHFRVP